MELMLTKNSANTFELSTDLDVEMATKIKIGQSVKAKVTKQTDRSIKHHRLFLAMLRLTLDYWTPDYELTSEKERKLIYDFCYIIDAKFKCEIMTLVGDDYLSYLARSRADKVQVERKSIDGLLVWVKDKVGHVDFVITPEGIKRVPKSINFNAMKQEEFAEFYKKAFGVCWRLVLSHEFSCEAECQNVINNMLSMG